VEQLKKAVLGSKNCSWDSVSGCFKPILQYIDGLAARLGQPLFTILFVCVIVLLLTMLFCLSGYRRKKQDASKFLSPNVSSTEEDNFMAGKEGHAAKLNLARAYIDMGKETEAHVMLDEVLAKGSPSEQEKAKMLLAEIKKL
jgi:FimV-like protein